MTAPGFQEHLNACLNAWAERFGPRFILGLSGGGDSMAMALGCAVWVRSGKGQVHCVCVDHGLRTGSQEEANQTIAWAKSLGLTGETLSVNMTAGQSRIQERARQARHLALAEAAKAQGARMILLAHTLNDQHETLVMRLASKTGLDGLAGMAQLAPSPFYASDWPCLVGRPLLGFARDDLRDHLVQAGQSWHEDPSNQNLAFARIRARARLAQFKAARGDVDVLGAIAGHAAFLRQSMDGSARALLIRADLQINADQISMNIAPLRQSSASICERALGWLAFCVGNPNRLPDTTKITRLRSTIMAPNFRGVTLAGAQFKVQNNRLIVAPAPPRRGQEQLSFRDTVTIKRRLAAISTNFEQFVTQLG